MKIETIIILNGGYYQNVDEIDQQKLEKAVVCRDNEYLSKSDINYIEISDSICTYTAKLNEGKYEYDEKFEGDDEYI
jgi:hypothetical protein